MRIRFSLRTFLIAVAVTGAAFGGAAAWRQNIVDRAERHLRALKVMQIQSNNPVIAGADKHPGYVNFVRKWIHPRAFEVKDRVCAPRSYFTPQYMASLRDVYGLENVTCSFDRFTVQDAKALAAVSQLRQLFLSFGAAEPEALVVISKIPTLESLSVHGTMDGSFFQAVRNHQRLSKLTLDTPLTPELAADLVAMPKLVELYADAKHKDSAIIRDLARSKFETLSFKTERCDSESLTTLGQSQLKEFVLFCPQIEAGTLKAISNAKKLERLELFGHIQFAPDELESLKACNSLIHLHLKSVWLTAEQWEDLTSHPTLMTVCVYDGQGNEDAIGRFEKSKAGREVTLP